MYTKLKQFKCGGCGHDSYSIFQEEDNDQRIVTECNNCKSQSEIVIRPAHLSIQFGESGDGRMCFFD
jgi:transcription elongation factor Elf1